MGAAIEPRNRDTSPNNAMAVQRLSSIPGDGSEAFQEPMPHLGSQAFFQRNMWMHLAYGFSLRAISVFHPMVEVEDRARNTFLFVFRDVSCPLEGYMVCSNFHLTNSEGRLVSRVDNASDLFLLSERWPFVRCDGCFGHGRLALHVHLVPHVSNTPCYEKLHGGCAVHGLLLVPRPRAPFVLPPFLVFVTIRASRIAVHVGHGPLPHLPPRFRLHDLLLRL